MNEEALARAIRRAHLKDLFNRLWNPGPMRRKDAYSWVSAKIGVSRFTLTGCDENERSLAIQAISNKLAEWKRREEKRKEKPENTDYSEADYETWLRL